MEIWYRESKDSGADVPRNLRERGLGQPLVFVGDGNLGAEGNGGIQGLRGLPRADPGRVRAAARCACDRSRFSRRWCSSAAPSPLAQPRSSHKVESLCR